MHTYIFFSVQVSLQDQSYFLIIHLVTCNTLFVKGISMPSSKSLCIITLFLSVQVSCIYFFFHIESRHRMKYRAVFNFFPFL